MGLASNSPWQTVASAALIGTERQPLTPPSEPGSLGQVLGQFGSSTPEATLMKVAATLSLHQQTGQLPEHYPLPTQTPCDRQDLPRCNVRATLCLQQMLQGPYAQLLPEWLMEATTAHQRVPEMHLPDLLDLGKTRSDLRGPILPVLGQRGRWLAAQNPDWSYAVTVATSEDWETGSQAARVLYLQALRSEDPALARDRLRSTWNQEPAGDRARFLETFQTGLSLDDEPFLDDVLGDRSQQVRRVAADLLARLPDSRLCQRMENRLKQYVKFNADGEIEISLPETCDADMQRDGIEVRPRVANLGERTWWLQQLIGATPLRFWEPSKECSAGEWSQVIIDGWQLAVERQRNPHWARILLNGWVADSVENVRSLLAVFPGDEQETVVVELIQTLSRSIHSSSQTDEIRRIWILFRAIAQPGRTWGEDLSRLALRQISNPGMRGDPGAIWEFSELLKELSLCLLPDVLTDVEKLYPDPERPDADQRLDQFLVTAIDRFLEMLQFRNEMRQAFSKR